MTAFAVTRTWLLLASSTIGVFGCATRLGDLQGYDSEALGSSELIGATEALAPPSAPNDESQAVSSVELASDATVVPPAPTVPTPICTDGELNSDGFCVPEVRCAPGTFVSRLEGFEVCFPCESGQFSSDYDAERCQSWRDCDLGQYVEQSGTATRDRQCAECPAGETTSSKNAGECSGASDCAAGTRKSDGGCAACSPGTYCSGKTDQEIACDAGSWDNDRDPATPCEVKTNCAPGQVVDTEGDAITDRSCGFCEADAFSAEMNATTCERWSSCGAGTYVSLQGTSTSDRECATCPAGTFTAQSNESACAPWTVCAAPSQYAAVEPSAERDRSCSACAEGVAASADNLTSCDVVVPANLVNNYDFESAATTGWVSWIGTLSTSTLRAHSGTRSLLVTGSGTGPAATELNSVVEAGATYNVSFWVDVGKVSTAQVNLTRALTCGGNVTYLWLANNPAVPNGTWTRLTGRLTVPETCAAPKLMVYAEGSGSNVDLYVDSVNVTKVE